MCGSNFFRSKTKKLNVRKLHIFLLLFIGFISNSLAQTDTLVYENEVLVKGLFRVRETAIGSKVILFNKEALDEYVSLHLGDLIQIPGKVYLKTFGGNGLSTLSIRGSSGSQNLVLWNGLPIQSSMLGLLDLSLIPSNFSSQISLELGGNSSSWGSGAVGGIIKLDNYSNFKDETKIDYASSLGSFGNLHQKIGLQLGNKNFQSHSQFIYQAADNDFTFKPLPTLPKKTQENAAFKQLAFMQSFYGRINLKHQINFHIWGQGSYKEIPALLTQQESEAYQNDENVRSVLHWQFYKLKQVLSAKAAYFIENQHFIDPLAQIDAQNNFSTFLGEFSFQRHLKHEQKIDLTSSNQFTKASSPSYKNDQHLLRTALLFAYSLNYKKIKLQASIREEWADKVFQIPTTYLGMNVNVNRFLTIHSKISRDFRLPSLNDRYWSPGGNPNLKAEQGWSEEIGLDFSFKKNDHVWYVTQTFYNRNMNNWIIWKPSLSNSFWEASNVAKVWSRGIETSFSYQFSKNSWKLRANANFSYNRSSYQIELKLPAIEKGDQLFYTPIFQTNLKVELSYKNLQLSYYHFYVSETLGANDVLPAYHFANILANYQWKHQKVAGSIFLTVNNIYNASYQVVERRPMAGTNYQLGMQIHFTQQKKSL